MMPGMHRPRRLLGFLCCVGVVACAGVSPRPEAARADRLPERTLSADERVRCDEAVGRAIEAVVRRNYTDAEAAARDAIDLDPRSARARAVLGMVLLQRSGQQDPPELRGMRAGEVEIELAYQLAPGDAFVGWMRAVFLAETGHMSAAADAAEAALDRATAAPPGERAALLGIAGTYRYELGEERAALPHLQQYLALRPDDATAYFRLGASLLRIASLPQGVPPTSYQVAERQAQAAARAFARCHELAPGDEDAALAVAAASWRAGELAAERGDDAAVQAHRQAVVAQLRAVAAAFPGSAEPHFRLGVVAADDGQIEAARAAYVAALERDPVHPGSVMNLAALEVEAGEPAVAAQRLSALLSADAQSQLLSRDERRRIADWLAGRARPGDAERAGAAAAPAPAIPAPGIPAPGIQAPGIQAPRML